MTQTETSEPLVLVTPELLMPQGQRFWLDDDMLPRDKHGMPVPSLKVKEVAEVFFGKSDDWLRWLMRPNDKRIKDASGAVTVIPGDHPDGFFILDGKPLDFKRTKSKARYFTLADVERMAHALAEGQRIDGATFMLSMRMVVTCARLHGIIP